MREHLDDQRNHVQVETSKTRCSHGVPNKGRCDLAHGHYGPHCIFGVDAEREEFYQGASSNLDHIETWKWVLTDRPSVKPTCSACGKS